jgi:hypothetical protein
LQCKAKLLNPLITNSHAALQHVKAAAEQFKTIAPRAVLLRYLSDMTAPALALFKSLAMLTGTGHLLDLGRLASLRAYAPAIYGQMRSAPASGAKVGQGLLTESRN